MTNPARDLKVALRRPEPQHFPATTDLGRAYNRTEFVDQRREMLQAWADYLDQLRRGGNAVSQGRAKQARSERQLQRLCRELLPMRIPP